MCLMCRNCIFEFDKTNFTSEQRANFFCLFSMLVYNKRRLHLPFVLAIFEHWSKQSVCSALGLCSQNVEATIHSIPLPVPFPLPLSFEILPAPTLRPWITTWWPLDCSSSLNIFISSPPISIEILCQIRTKIEAPSPMRGSHGLMAPSTFTFLR